MARKRDRVFALVMAAAFLFTTVGVSAALIWQIANENKDKKTDQQTATGMKGTKMQDFTPIAKVTELQIIDITPGTGQEVKANDKVTVDYTGALAATGKIFESSVDSGQRVTFGLDQVIAGWGEGLVGMKVGGKRRLVIPAEKAYGANSPSASIPANADLVFDITLYEIAK